MKKFVDYYKVLEIHQDAGQEIINAAYRCFSKIYHPDVNDDPNATERMKTINVAYNAIKDPKKRSAYHNEWIKHNTTTRAAGNFSRQTAGSQGAYSPNNFARYQATRVSEERLAEKFLKDFFDDIVKENWEKSYDMLTREDNKNISLKEYMEWKQAVTHLYKLGNYKIQHFKTYENCEYGGNKFSRVFHFSVTLTEMEVFTGIINHENTQKYVAYDGNRFKVCLGYSDLRPSIRKYRYLAQSIPRINREEILSKALDNIDPITGLLSRKGFAAQAEREFHRSKRYGNPLTLATVEIRRSRGGSDIYTEENEMLISNAAELLSANIRNTDIIGKITETAIGIIFIETNVENVRGTLLRLLRLVELGEALDYEIYWAMESLDSCEVEDLLSATLKKAVLIDRTMKSDSIEEVKIKKEPIFEFKINRNLKYRLSDILEFNKKGFNHF